MREFAVVVGDGFEGERPDAVRFVDMTGEDLFIDGVDLDLSHWMPNRTPPEVRADTSTEICLNWMAAHPDDQGVAVNGHADTDGTLSIFVMCEPELALEHRDLIVAVAEMGDFGFGGDRDVALLYADLKLLLVKLRGSVSMRQTFEQANAFMVDWLSGRIRPTSPAEAAADALASSQDMAATSRHILDDRLVGFVVEPDDDGYLVGFDNILRDRLCLSPQARNTLDKERVQVVAQPAGDDRRWRYAVCYPQYLPWDTETLWRPPGWVFTGNQLSWDYVGDALSDLASFEAWELRSPVAPWSEGFPAVLHTPHPVADDPDVVFARLVESLKPELSTP